MQKNTIAEKNYRIKMLTVSAMMVALSVVIGYICKTVPILNMGVGLRITFENLPIILAGIMFGPIVGACVGFVADMLSCIFSGQAPLLFVSLGSISVGLVAGICSKYIVRKNGVWKIVLSEALAHLIGSVIIKTVALSMAYGYVIVLRIPLGLAIAAAEIVIVLILYRNKTIRKLVDSGGREN